MRNMKKKILVIDDDINLTQLVKIYLERDGEYKVMVENHSLKYSLLYETKQVIIDFLKMFFRSCNLEHYREIHISDRFPFENRKYPAIIIKNTTLPLD